MIVKRLSFCLVTYLSLKVVIMIFQLIVLLVLFCGCEIRKWVIYCFFGRWAGGKKMLRSIEIHDFIVQLNVIFT